MAEVLDFENLRGSLLGLVQVVLRELLIALLIREISSEQNLTQTQFSIPRENSTSCCNGGAFLRVTAAPAKRGLPRRRKSQLHKKPSRGLEGLLILRNSRETSNSCQQWLIQKLGEFDHRSRSDTLGTWFGRQCAIRSVIRSLNLKVKSVLPNQDAVELQPIMKFENGYIRTCVILVRTRITGSRQNSFKSCSSRRLPDAPQEHRYGVLLGCRGLPAPSRNEVKRFCQRFKASTDGTTDTNERWNTSTGSISFELIYNPQNIEAISAELADDESKSSSISYRAGEPSSPASPNDNAESPLPGNCGIKWSSIPNDIREYIITKLPYEDVFCSKLLSKKFRDFIERESFETLRGQMCSIEVSLTAPYFFIKDGVWQCAGYDIVSKKWRSLPPLTYLSTPEPDLCKEYLVCAQGGLFCINVSKSSEEETLIVFNPLTRKKKVLPPLNQRRNPVLMHMLVDPATEAFKVIVAGSSRCGHDELSRMTEVFDSCTSTWETTGDIPGPNFALNEYQTGVYVNGFIYCIAFLEGENEKGLLAYDVEKGQWLSNWRCVLPLSIYSNIHQLVDIDGNVALFSEREDGRNVEHCIDILLENSHSVGGVPCKWTNVITEKKVGGRGLQVYPESVCVPFGKGNVCVFNSINHAGVVYDISNGRQSNLVQLPSPPESLSGQCFFSLNPMSSTIELSYKSKSLTYERSYKPIHCPQKVDIYHRF